MTTFMTNDPRQASPVLWVFWPSVRWVLLIIEKHPRANGERTSRRADLTDLGSAQTVLGIGLDEG
jgi:hypothetical protein